MLLTELSYELIPAAPYAQKLIRDAKDQPILISGNTLEMLNDVKISIPRRSSEEVQNIYMDFCRKEALK